MFSPWTQGRPNFWLVMSFAAIVLSSLCLAFTQDRKALLRVEKPLQQALAGIVIAFALWGVFWVGDKASAFLFDFARTQVDNVYSMKAGLPQWLIALLLIFLIGPAEELFWRGYVQRTFSRLFGGKHPADLAFIVTALIYALVHIWSFNFMLVMAALVAGAVWGFIYRISPKTLPALVVSHALWDVLVFILLPI
jgi:membrane protease YdiL (CAAX protease family)